MAKYIVKRLGIGVITLFVLVTITFFLTRLMPGNPFESTNISSATLEQISAKYGLDQPVLDQYTLYLRHLLHGDLGISYKKSNVSVNDLIKMGAPATMRLGIIAYMVALVVGIPLGILMATTKKEKLKGGLLTLTTLGISVPNYIFAIILMLIFGVSLRWFPTLGLSSPRHYVLPVLTQAVYPIAQITRLTQSGFAEAINQDYVVLARAKGLKERTVRYRHVLKNAILPIITVSGPMLAFLLTGSFVVESIFTIPGIGKEFVTSVTNRDYTVIMGLTVFFGMMIIVANLLSDIVCSLVDPRIKLND